MSISVEPRCWMDGRLDVGAYAIAIRHLEAARMQLEPDGGDCSVCGGSDHQAFECEFNPLYMARLAIRRTVHQQGSGALSELSDASEYRCFHCGFTPQSYEEAREHYGDSRHEIPVCLARTDAEAIAAIVEAIWEADDAAQAEIMVRHLLRGAGCEDDDAEESDT